MELTLYYNNLKNTAISINSDISASKRKLNGSRTELNLLEDEIADLKNNGEIQQSSIEILKKIVENMSKEHINQIEDLLTYGLQTIFYDRDYEIEIQVEDKRNNNYAEIFLIERVTNDNVLRTSFNNSRLGGGIRTVVGFLLQVFYIGYFNLNPIIFCDEAFSQISDDYLDGFMEFINHLSDKKGFKIVLITHDDRLKEYARMFYRIELGQVTLEKSQKEGDTTEKSS